MTEHDKNNASALPDQDHTREQLHAEGLEESLQLVSGAASDHDLTRAPLRTEHGREERLKHCINARRGKLRLLTAKSNYIESHMTSDAYVMNIEHSEMESYKKLVEEFMEANVNVVYYLQDEEKQADQENWFQPKLKSCKDFIHSTYEWIEETKLKMSLQETLEKDVSPSESASNMTNSRRSSKSGSVKTVRSAASAARLKEEANRAALIAKAASLKGRQALELKEAQLRAEKEQLEVETALAISAAKIKVYKENESPTTSDIRGYVPSAFKSRPDSAPVLLTPVVKPKVPNTQQRVKSSPAGQPMPQNNDTSEFCRVMHRQTELTELIVKNQQLSRLPKRDVPVFHGDPLEFKTFIRAFEHAIDSRAESSEDKLHFLEQYTRGEPKDLVKSCQHMTGDRGYREALRLLHDRYGNELKIASALMEKASKWPQIKSEDGKALSTFSLFLVSCRNTMEDVQYMDELDNPTNMRVIISKLPYKLKEKWRGHAFEIQEKRNRRARFDDLVTFVDRQAQLITDPLFGDVLDATSERKQKGKQDSGPGTKKEGIKKEGKKGSSFATSVTTVEKDQGNAPKTKADATAPVSAFTKPCVYCEKNHTLEECYKMRDKTHKDKIEFLKKAGLCFGCLVKGHVSKDCKKRLTCQACSLKHPSMLHFAKQEKSDKENTDEDKVEDGTIENTTVSSALVTINSETTTCTGAGDDCILAIVPVQVKLKKGSKIVETYAFMDPGSSATFCTNTLASQLNIQGRRTELDLTTMSPKIRVESYILTDLEVSGLRSSNFIDLPKVFTQKSIPVSRKNIPTQKDIEKWPYLDEVTLPTIDADVGLLIGTNVHKALEPWQVINSRDNGPYAVKTALGWIVNGPLKEHKDTDTDNDTCTQVTVNRVSIENVEQLLVQQFNQDFPERGCDEKQEMSHEDKQFMDSVTASAYHADGHHYIGLPKKNPAVIMPNNRSAAVQRALTLKRKLSKNPGFHQEYNAFMSDMISKGYAVKVPEEQLSKQDGKVWYVPHHGVYHPQKKKLRVVFDCAARFQGTSLNDELLQGPDLANSLIGVLLRFRQENVAVMADIEAMYHQVRVPEDDINLFRFLWWPDGDTGQDMVEYQMTVHVFGATSSPSCANFALRKTAEENRSESSQEAVDTVLNNFYIDDCLTSVSSVSQAIALYKDLVTLCASGGFNLTKWTSNSRDFLAAVPENDRAKDVRNVDLSQDVLPIERALGVLWCIESDTFMFRISVKDKPVTRRGILSTVCSIYDPLGFLSPFILPAKCLMQQLSREKLAWDEPIPDNLAQRWFEWLKDLHQLATFSVSRCIKPVDFGDIKTAQIHHFSDASESGYGTVSYLRLTNDQGRVHCAFLLGKSRVAPLKLMTIPRMELAAAVVAVNIDKMIKKELQLALLDSTFWTDSTTVLKYIANDTLRFKTFVANRISTIRDTTKLSQWRYINTVDNPADCASRGLTANKLMSHQSWIHGPSFLQEPENQWPDRFHNSEVEEDDVEVRKSVTANLTHITEQTTAVNKLFNYYSNWYKLKKAVAWMLNLKETLRSLSKKRQDLQAERKNSQADPDTQKATVEKQMQAYKAKVGKQELTVEDLQKAETEIIRFSQNQRFQEEISTLEKGTHGLKRSSPIYKLDPMLQDGILRVGGRLNKSAMPAESRHPAIIPKDLHITSLILQDIHEKIGHSGRNYMLSRLRQRFWIPAANSAVRKFLSSCVTCRKVNAKRGEQKMADLPKDRLQPDKPPFTNVGVDYFGPFMVKRGRATVKRYGVLFTCLTTRAVHIEVAHTLDTDSCLNAIRRFVCRRGHPSIMRSDNGTNLAAAERELREAIQSWNQTKMQDSLRQKGIQWIFNPPAGSHFGGIWERQIRSVRKILKSVLKEQVVDDEALQTLFCEVEAIINDRPITNSSDNSNDLEGLTPNHLLLLKREPLLPPGLFEKDDLYSRRRWKQVQYLADLFWKRWVREYLPLQQERQKWSQVRQNLKPGDVVMIVDDSAPRNSWLLGRVTQTIPDSKGLVRRVLVKTKTNILERPVDKLCLVCETDS